LGLTVCLSPLLLLLVSLTYGLVRRADTDAGLGWMLAAAALGLFDLYLSFVRPAIFHLRHGSIKQYRHVSGIPGVGTLLVVVGARSGFGGVVSAVVGVTAMLMDTGSSFWFLLATWGDSSFWDK
jgi:hypothetical protein